MFVLFSVLLQINARRETQRAVWVFGKVLIQFFNLQEIDPRRDRVILTGVLNRKLVTNSIIHSDEWRGYLNLPQFVPGCIQHNTVNHSFSFLEPVTGAHIQVSILFFLTIQLLFTATAYHHHFKYVLGKIFVWHSYLRQQDF